MPVERRENPGARRRAEAAAIGCWGGCWYGGCWGGCWPGLEADPRIVESTLGALLREMPAEMTGLFEQASRAARERK